MRWTIGLLLGLGSMWAFVIGINVLDSRKDLQIESLPGVEIEELICFDAGSGDILWKCTLEQAKNRVSKDFPKTSSTVGLGYFANSSSKAVIFFNYYCLNNFSLEARAAKNLKYSYWKKDVEGKTLRGKVLEYLERLSAAAESLLLVWLSIKNSRV